MSVAPSLFRHAGRVPASAAPQPPRSLDARHGGYRHKPVRRFAEGAGMAVVGVLALLATPALVQTQAQMNATAASDLRRADAVMTGQWKRTYASMKARDAQDTSRGGGFGYAAATLESQRAWLKFRDTQCVIEGGEFAGGSMQPLARANCLTRLTKERTVHLRKLDWNN